MSDTVPTPADKPYQPIAAELRRVADAIEAMPATQRPYVCLTILPDRTVEAVDAMALAVLGGRGDTERMGDIWRRIARGHLDSGVDVSIHAEVPGPPDERDAELERLRAEVAELSAALRSAGASDRQGRPRR